MATLSYCVDKWVRWQAQCKGEFSQVARSGKGTYIRPRLRHMPSPACSAVCIEQQALDLEAKPNLPGVGQSKGKMT